MNNFIEARINILSETLNELNQKIVFCESYGKKHHHNLQDIIDVLEDMSWQLRVEIDNLRKLNI